VTSSAVADAAVAHAGRPYAVEPPEHVRATFGLRGVPPIPLANDWDGGWRCDDVVLSPVIDHARAAWSAKVREVLAVDDIRLARPVSSTDGRYVVSGWRADTFVSGAPEPRYDEVIALAQRLHEATAALPRPRFLARAAVASWYHGDVFAAADRAAWEDEPLRWLGPVDAAGAVETPTPAGRHSVAALARLASLRKPVYAPAQLVHGDLFGTVLFDGALAPGLTDITPYWRPAPWAAAVAVVDALSWGGADEGLLERWADLAEWPQMLLRAVMFRLAVHGLHPRSTAEALPGLLDTAEMVRFLL
jgi:uncharacterized protein (TIGR02569 family)